MTACYFCELLKDRERNQERLLLEDDRIWVSHEIEPDGPTYRGAVVIVLKRHSDDGIAGITDQEGARIGRAVAQVSRAFQTVLGASWAYTYCFTEGFRHVHQFVVARYPNVPARYIRLGIQRWPKAPRGNAEEIRILVRSLRNALTGPTTGTVEAPP